MDEASIIKMILSRNPDGLHRLMDIYQAKAVRIAYLITHNHQESEDIAQTAFLRVYEHIDQYDHDKTFSPWFYRIVVNEALRSVKNESWKVSLDEELAEGERTLLKVLSDPTLDPENAVVREELRQSIRDALKKLTYEQRAAVVLRYYLGFSEKEMANSLNVPKSTVKWRLHTARKHLKAFLRSIFPAEFSLAKLPEISGEEND